MFPKWRDRAADKGGQQRQLVGHVAPAWLHGVAQLAVQRVEAPEQRPAQQHGRAQGHDQNVAAALGLRVVGSLLVGLKRAAANFEKPPTRVSPRHEMCGHGVQHNCSGVRRALHPVPNVRRVAGGRWLLVALQLARF